MVAAPLAVCVLENPPQAPAVPQVTLQSAPWASESLVTTAVTEAVLNPTAVLRVAGGGGAPKVIARAPALMITFPEAERVELVAEAAVMVTVVPEGTEMGAVKVVAVPLAVCVGLNEPQLAEAQVTVQLTPALEPSPVTTAAIMKLLPTLTLPGKADSKDTKMPGLGGL